MSLTGVAVTTLEQAMNRYLKLDPAAYARMARLHGRVIAIELAGLEQTLYLHPGPGGVQIFSHYEGEADCRLRGTPLALARMGDRQHSSDQLFAGEVAISGDTALAHEFGKILGEMSIDWEAWLAGYTGTLVAEDVADGLRKLAAAGRRSLNTLELDIRELLQRETRLLPSAAELELFLSEVDRVRDGVERLEARIALLQQKLPPHPHPEESQ